MQMNLASHMSSPYFKGLLMSEATFICIDLKISFVCNNFSIQNLILKFQNYNNHFIIEIFITILDKSAHTCILIPKLTGSSIYSPILKLPFRLTQK